MEKIRFSLLGGGKRSQFFMRAAKALPEIFEIDKVWLRNAEKAKEYAEKFDVNTTTDFSEVLKSKPLYVIVCLPRSVAVDYIEKVFEAGIAVLCETPPGNSVEDFERLWDLKEKYNGKIQVSEQYFAWPMFSAWLKAVGEGLIGEVSNVTISSLHGYHGTNIMRRFLGVTSENCKIFGKQYEFSVVEADTGLERLYDGDIMPYNRQKLTFEFDNGKVGFFDFNNVQYRSALRTRQLNVQGTKGEIDDLTIRYVNIENEIVTQNLLWDNKGHNAIFDWSIYGLTLGDKFYYKSPFKNPRINDDELAVATVMYLMKHFVLNEKEFYPLEEALQDSYLALKMNEALENPMKEIITTTQKWYKK